MSKFSILPKKMIRIKREPLLDLEGQPLLDKDGDPLTVTKAEEVVHWLWWYF